MTILTGNFSTFLCSIILQLCWSLFGLRKKNVTLLACDIYAFQTNNHGLPLQNVLLGDSFLIFFHWIILTTQQGYFVPGELFKLTSKTCHTLTILIFLVLPKRNSGTILLSVYYEMSTRVKVL